MVELGTLLRGVSQGNQGAGRIYSLIRGSTGEGSSSKITQTVGRINFLGITELRNSFSCWMLAETFTGHWLKAPLWFSKPLSVPCHVELSNVATCFLRTSKGDSLQQEGQFFNNVIQTVTDASSHAYLCHIVCWKCGQKNTLPAVSVNSECCLPSSLQPLQLSQPCAQRGI